MAALTEEQVAEQRKTYLLKMADELMTAPIEQLEFMYNETKRRIETQPEAEIYPKLKALLEQVAKKRSITIFDADDGFRFFK